MFVSEELKLLFEEAHSVSSSLFELSLFQSG